MLAGNVNVPPSTTDRQKIGNGIAFTQEHCTNQFAGFTAVSTSPNDSQIHSFQAPMGHSARKAVGQAIEQVIMIHVK